MPRLFASLAVATLILLVLAAGIAVFDKRAAPDRHVLIAVGALLLGCFTQVAGFTYLTVTGKVVAQAIHLSALDGACLARIKRYKRSFARYLAVAILTLCLVSATGGAAWRSPESVSVHILATILVAVVHAWVFRRQNEIIRSNAALVETTLKDYASWRNQRFSRKIAFAAGPEGEEPAS